MVASVFLVCAVTVTSWFYTSGEKTIDINKVESVRRIGESLELRHTDGSLSFFKNYKRYSCKRTED